MLCSYIVTVGASWHFHCIGCCLLPTAGTKAAWTLCHTISLIWQRCRHMPIPKPNHIPIASWASRDDCRKPFPSFCWKRAGSLENQAQRKDLSICTSKVEDPRRERISKLVYGYSWQVRPWESWNKLLPPSSSHQVASACCLLPRRWDTGVCGKDSVQSKRSGCKAHQGRDIHTWS